jgi:pimeloyl-ACP methyl ester carboxylesterase
MPTVVIDGIETNYEVYGSGPPLLMMAPGGFDSTIEKWSTAGVWKGMQPLESLAKHYTCIAYDRREAGASGGRVERLTWPGYAKQAKGLLEHLGHDRAFIMGGCMGVSVATAFGVEYPEASMGLVLHWPVGGPRWHVGGVERFDTHHAFLASNGLDAVVSLAKEGKTFWTDPEAGPWAATINNDSAFAKAFASQDADRYAGLIAATGRTLYDRDTAPGAEPEELMALKVPAIIIPGHDVAHATSAARYLEECLPEGEYWDVAVEQQTPEAVRERILGFLASLK